MVRVRNISNEPPSGVEKKESIVKFRTTLRPWNLVLGCLLLLACAPAAWVRALP